MTKEEIKRYVESDIKYACEEGGLEREEVLDMVMINIIYRYETCELTKEDLIQCADYLEYDIDIDKIDAAIAERKIKREKRTLQRKNRRSYERAVKDVLDHTKIEALKNANQK